MSKWRVVNRDELRTILRMHGDAPNAHGLGYFELPQRLSAFHYWKLPREWQQAYEKNYEETERGRTVLGNYQLKPGDYDAWVVVE